MKTDLFNESCLDVMSRYPDGWFDLAVTSPPYNMNLRVNSKGDGYCSRQVTKELSTKYENYADNLPMAEYEAFLDSVLGELVRVSKLTFFNIQMITGNKPALFRLMGKYADHIKEVIIWDKCKAQPAIGDGVLNSRFEFILVLGDRPITRAFTESKFKRGGLDNLWQISSGTSQDKLHRASFPKELTDTIMANFKSLAVIDPFLGTGTTAISAHFANALEFVGCEIDEGYFNEAKKRIDYETSQMDIFNG